MCFKFSKLRTMFGERNRSDRFDLEHGDKPIECYFATLAGLLGMTIPELERTTGVDASTEMSGFKIWEFYWRYGYNGDGNVDYEWFDTRDQMKRRLYKIFNKRLRRTAPHERNNLRMKLAAVYYRKPVWDDGQLHDYGHVVALKFCSKNDQIRYRVVDYQEDVGDRAEDSLPEDDEVVGSSGFGFFTPIFYFKST